MGELLVRQHQSGDLDGVFSDPSLGVCLEPIPNPDSLALVLDHMHRLAEQQWQESLKLDSKANFTLTAGTVLAAGVISSSDDLIRKSIDDWASLYAGAVAASLIIYLGLIVTVWQAHRIRAFFHPPEPERLYEFAHFPVMTAQDYLSDGIKGALLTNQATMEDKAWWLKWAERFLIVEAGWIAVVVAWRVSF